MNNNNLKQYAISPGELADLFNISPQAICQYLKKKNYGFYKEGQYVKIPSQEVRKYLLDKNFSYRKQTISFQIIKGGTGKSTICHALAIRCNQYGARVLAIDFDQQAHLTLAFGIEDEKCQVWFNIINGNISIQDAIKQITPTLHLIPSNLNNSYVNKYISSEPKINIAKLVSRQINKVKDNYDIILMDCAPALSHLNTAIACASDTIIIPTNPDRFSFDGLNKTLKEFNEISTQFDAAFKAKIIFNKYDARERSGNIYLTLLTTNYSDLLFQCFIRHNADLKNAIQENKSVFDSLKKTNSREDLDIFAREILGLRN